ncbi:hypothetical protein M0P65_00345 [Candidatus Gracilibacteria bacterium]|nr:hypothetical protein [Candidatus Gracilibacteria bacterium]
MSDILPQNNTLSSGEKNCNYLEKKALKDKNNQDLNNILKDILFALNNNPSQRVITSAENYIKELEMLKLKYETGTYFKSSNPQIYTKREDLIKHIEEITEDFDNLSDEFVLYSDIKKILDNLREYPNQKKELLVSIDKSILPDGAHIDNTTGNIELNILSPILGIGNINLNGVSYNNGAFSISGQKFIINTQSLRGPFLGVTDTYTIIINEVGGGQIQVTLEISKGSYVWVKSLSVHNFKSS